MGEEGKGGCAFDIEVDLVVWYLQISSQKHSDFIGFGRKAVIDRGMVPSELCLFSPNPIYEDSCF